MENQHVSEDKNTVTQQFENEQDVQVEASEKNLSGFSAWYEHYKKQVLGISGLIVALALGLYYYNMIYMPEQEAEAANAMYWAEDFFAKDSFKIALNGGITVLTPDGPKTMSGFLQIADAYSATKPGNLAYYYAGVCLMRLGKFQDAISNFERYSNDDVIVKSMAEGSIGDAYVELGKSNEGIDHYLKASKISNTFTSPLFLKKAATIYEVLGDYANALLILDRIQTEFHNSTEASDVAKAIARVKAKQIQK